MQSQPGVNGVGIGNEIDLLAGMNLHGAGTKPVTSTTQLPSQQPQDFFNPTPTQSSTKDSSDPFADLLG